MDETPSNTEQMTMAMRTAKYIGLLAATFGLLCGSSGCGGSETPPPSTKDSVNYVSENFYTHDTISPEIVEDLEPKHHKGRGRKHHNSSDGSNHSGGTDFNPEPRTTGGGGGSGVDVETAPEPYPRNGDRPEDFARAIAIQAIQMVYPDGFKAPQIQVINSKETDGQLVIEVRLRWRDRWVRRPYEITGTLTVGKDGKNAHFEITAKNPEAEALEFTFDAFKTSLDLEQI